MLQHLTLINARALLKNKLTEQDKMKDSNNNNYMLKCYLNVFKIVPAKMESNPFSYANVKDVEKCF